ncbi:hypothetical protein [Streptomyces sp. AP-93]|uniref:hypothetical protein n=1 Tax=Streptomyces sp. AP-93 TaxID=2929048 RepID=UPI001FAF2769|nr:hypothetical protein [Streptomyces sp. AP-93]MCJ0874328.1 hypothetical protein [Streptomyces sp. AP-93]
MTLLAGYGAEMRRNVESLCDAPYGTDTEVATSAQGIAVVEATGPAGPVSLEGISDAEARKFVTTPVRVLEVVKEEWAPAVAITQRVQAGGAPGSYTLTVTPNRQEVLLEAGRQYVVAVGPGDLTAGPGTKNYGFAFAEVVQPVKRGVAGEAAYWRDVLAKAPPKPACDDTVTS